MSNDRKYRVIDRKFIPMKLPNVLWIPVIYTIIHYWNISVFWFGVYIVWYLIILFAVIFVALNEDHIQL